MEQITFTDHARIRISARRIPQKAVAMALLFGREMRMKGATFYAIGRKEVERFKKTGVELTCYEGIQVVCAEDDVVVTAYRNKDFTGLRPRNLRKGRRGRRQQSGLGYNKAA
jgi:hypothetical protein